MVQRGRDWEELGPDLMRGIGGGVIIGMPLVYTMELWHIGMYVSDWFIVVFLLFVLAVNTGLNHASGFTPEHNLASDFGASVTALGISAVLGFICLTLIGSIHPGISYQAAMSMISLVAIPISIGFSIANTHFGGKTRSTGEDADEPKKRAGEDIEKWKAKVDMRDIGVTIAGATVFVFSIAPVEEISLIAARTTGYHWAALVVFSLLLTYGMVFVADFAGQKHRRSYQGLLQHPVPETLLSYGFSVLTALAIMLLLGRTDVFSALSYTVANVAIIGLPASIGGAAGRLIV